MKKSFGFVGLGQMGSPMAKNISKAFSTLYVFDKAGSLDKGPRTATHCRSIDEVSAQADTIFFSLPDSHASISVARKVASHSDVKTSLVVDLSTIGPEAAFQAEKILSKAGIEYVDAPVSGGASGAKSGSITVMWAGSREQFNAHRDVLKSFSKNQFHVGSTPGQGQTVKILNNFLSGTAMIATSEAILYGLSQGIEMGKMLDVINVSTGQNTASSDKFPNRILTKTYDAGFKTSLLAKDVELFLKNSQKAGTPNVIGTAVADLWARCNLALPESDFTRIFDFIRKTK